MLPLSDRFDVPELSPTRSKDVDLSFCLGRVVDNFVVRPEHVVCFWYTIINKEYYFVCVCTRQYRSLTLDMTLLSIPR